jgi:hypothetical protein
MDKDGVASVFSDAGHGFLGLGIVAVGDYNLSAFRGEEPGSGAAYPGGGACNDCHFVL